MATTPFAPGSVSIRLYPHNELDPAAVVRELCAQACLALESGFDGMTAGEHHGGFAGYLPQPLQMAGFVLEESSSGWAAAAPLLLPLRPTALVAEEVAWLNARHPGRVGLGVAAGALPRDFEIAGADITHAAARFTSALPRLVAMLRGVDLGELSGDGALAACRHHPVTVLSAAVSATAARRAARCGAGILMEGMSDAGRAARLVGAFDAAGGTGPKVLIRRVWLGESQAELIRRQRAVYDSYAATDTTFGADQTVVSADPAEVTGRLAELVRACGADALSLRLHLPGMTSGAVREQIDALGAHVVGALKDELAPGSGSATGQRTGDQPPPTR